jgi:hypothetical protein
LSTFITRTMNVPIALLAIARACRKMTSSALNSLPQADFTPFRRCHSASLPPFFSSHFSMMPGASLRFLKSG